MSRASGRVNPFHCLNAVVAEIDAGFTRRSMRHPQSSTVSEARRAFKRCQKLPKVVEKHTKQHKKRVEMREYNQFIESHLGDQVGLWRQYEASANISNLKGVHRCRLATPGLPPPSPTLAHLWDRLIDALLIAARNLMIAANDLIL